MLKKSGQKFIFLLVALAVTFSFAYPGTSFALTSAQLKAQQDAARAAAAAAAAAKAVAQQNAAIAQTQIDALNVQMSQTQSAIEKTQSQIATTERSISDLSAQIEQEVANLAQEKARRDAILASWYMEGESGLLESVLGSSTISDVVDQQQQYDAIKEQIQTSMDKINAITAELNNQKQTQQDQLSNLQTLQSDQSSRQQSLQYSQAAKSRYLNNTVSAIADYQAQQQAYEAKIAQLQAQINALSSTRSWGTDIVSSSGGLGVPYYTQTGDNTHLGNTSYTVALYGCLITSMAMVSTYFGHYTTPDEIAADAGNFNSEGYLLGTPPEVGVSISSSRGINWETVNSQLDMGRPVIVSIYLPSVGAINSDGSSHFIVIKGRSGSSYYMNDPISGQRGYALSQVRSMKLVTP